MDRLRVSIYEPNLIYELKVITLLIRRFVRSNKPTLLEVSYLSRDVNEPLSYTNVSVCVYVIYVLLINMYIRRMTYIYICTYDIWLVNM